MRYLSKGVFPFSFTIASLIMMLFLVSCQNDKTIDTRDYFFPLQQWSSGMVYEYQPLNDELPVEYWYLRKWETDSATYLVGQYLDYSFTVRQLVTSELTEAGEMIQEYSLMEYDSTGEGTKFSAEIIAPLAFPFDLRDTSKTFITTLKWPNPTPEYPEGYIEMTRRRSWAGNTNYSFHGASRESIAFDLEETVDDFNDGHLEKTFGGKEIYAKDLGLVYYKKEIDDNFVLEYELRDTFSMAKLEEKFKSYLGEEQ